jgi:hypothetical protein
VDDGLACSNRPKVFEAILLEHLRKKCQSRTLPTKRFVGLDITRNREDRKFSVNQPESILKKYNMEDCNQVSIPADPNNRVNAKMIPNTEEDKREMEKCPVREGIGSLMYLANKPRPDISFALNQISAFVSNPGYGHWEAIKRVLAFLAWTKNHGICLCGNNINSETPLIGFTDADFASDTEKENLQQASCFNSMEEEFLGPANA